VATMLTIGVATQWAYYTTHHTCLNFQSSHICVAFRKVGLSDLNIVCTVPKLIHQQLMKLQENYTITSS
jgi:hypothetical protein